MCSFLYRNTPSSRLIFKIGSPALDRKQGGNKWTQRKSTSVHTQFVPVRQRQASIAARSARQWKRRRTSIAGANTRHAKATRTRNCIINRLRFRLDFIKGEIWGKSDCT